MVAAVGIGASVIGGIFSSSSASKAAKAQAAAQREATAEQRRQYNQTRTDLQPWRGAGGTALGQLGGALGFGGQAGYDRALAGYTESPYLANLVKKSGEAVEASRAAKGGLFSGGTAQEIGDRAGQLYLSDWNNYLGNLKDVSGQGLGATGTGAQLGQQSANAISQGLQNMGTIKANQYANQAGTVGNVLGQVTQGLGQGAFGFGSNPSNNNLILSAIGSGAVV